MLQFVSVRERIFITGSRINQNHKMQIAASVGKCIIYILLFTLKMIEENYTITAFDCTKKHTIFQVYDNLQIHFIFESNFCQPKFRTFNDSICKLALIAISLVKATECYVEGCYHDNLMWLCVVDIGAVECTFHFFFIFTCRLSTKTFTCQLF